MTGVSSKRIKRVPVIFFRTEAGGEPVREWLKGLPYADDRKRIGEDIKTVEYGWPVGMPLCRPLGRAPAEDLELARRNMKKHQKGMP
jgi:hypothetical protein